MLVITLLAEWIPVLKQVLPLSDKTEEDREWRK